MRSRFSLLIASIAVLPIFASCDLSADFWDIRELPIDIPAGAQTMQSPQTQTVSLADHPEISSKLKQLKDVDIVEIWLDVESVDMPTITDANQALLASGSLDVQGPNDGSQWTHVGTYTDLKVYPGGRIEVQPDKAVVDQVRKWATTDPFKFNITFSGQLTNPDHSPIQNQEVKFTAKSRVHFVATAGL